MLKREPFEFPFITGIDTLTSDRAQSPPSLSRLENAVLKTVGTLKKRNGYTAMSAESIEGQPLGEVLALAQFQDELLAFNGTQMFSYAETSAGWVEKGHTQSIGVKCEYNSQNTVPSAAPSIVVSGGLRYEAYSHDGEVYANVVDIATGTVIVSEHVVGIGTSPVIVTSAADNAIIMFHLADNWLWQRVWDGTAWGSRIAIANTNVFGATSTTTQSGVYIAYYASATGTSHILRVNSTTGAVIRTINLASTTLSATAYTFRMLQTEAGVDSGVILALRWGGASQFLRVFYESDDSGLALGNPFYDVSGFGTIDHAAFIPIDNVTVTLLFSITTDSVLAYERAIFEYVFDIDETPSAGALNPRSSDRPGLRWASQVSLAAHPFEMNGRWYVPCLGTGISTLQNGFYLFDYTAELVVAKAAYTQAVASAYLPVCSIMDDLVYMPVLLQGRVNQVDVQSFASDITLFTIPRAGIVTFDFAMDTNFQTAQLGNNLHISGGMLQTYDGKQLFEHGFFLFPDGVTALGVPAGTALTAGTYLYKAMYEWTDAKGQIHRSAASPTATVTMAAGDSGVVVVPTLRLTNRDMSAISIALYRTEADSTVFYRTTSISGTTANDPGDTTVTITDTTSDDDLATHELLYTNGGELDNDSPPPCALLITAKNRLFCVDEFGDLWFSKEYITGEAVGWSLALKKTVARDGGVFTALGKLDDKVIVFTPTRSYFFAGDGPTPAGTEDTFTVPAELPFKLGCANPNSIVEFDRGLFFESARGVWLLDRGLNAVAIGRNLAAYDGLTISGAIHKKDLDQVWLSTLEGTMLVYDYTREDGPGAWSTFTGLGTNDIVLDRAGMAILAKTGRGIWLETADLFTDDGAYISMLVETCWIALAGRQGWKRVYEGEILGDLRSHHTLNIDVLFDYIDTPVSHSFATTTALPNALYGDAATYGADSIYGGAADNLYHFRVQPEKQECIAIKYRIWDSDQTGTGESMNLNSLMLDIGVKPGLARLREGRST